MPEDYYSIAVDFSQADTDGVLVTQIRLAGELDLDASDELRVTILGLVAGNRTTEIVLDFSAVTFIDSWASTGVFDGYQAAQDAGVRFRAVGIHGIVKRVLTVLGLDFLLDPDATA